MGVMGTTVVPRRNYRELNVEGMPATIPIAQRHRDVTAFPVVTTISPLLALNRHF
jgi:hypothetical protein